MAFELPNDRADAAQAGRVDHGSAGSPPGILIRATYVLPMGPGTPVLHPGWVRVVGATITAIGAGIPPPAGAGVRLIDADGSVVLPGLVNAHTHAEQSFMRGVADDRPLEQWLSDAVGPLQKAMTPDEVYSAVRLGLVENLLSGATSVVQHLKVTTSREHVAAAIQAADEVGLRTRIARAWRDSGSSGETTDATIAETLWVSDRCKQSPSGLLSAGFGPTWMVHCSDAGLEETSQIARAYGLFTHLHVAETEYEVAAVLKSRGQRPVERLCDLGLVHPDLHLVHVVHLSRNEISALADAGATVVHCPTSNAHLACGLAPITALRHAGVVVALGTDGPASNNSQSPIETAKFAVLTAKAREHEAGVIGPEGALRMLTVSGARIMGAPGLGELAPGKVADLTIVKVATARSGPVHCPASAVVMSATSADVRTVIVAGRVLVENGRSIRFEEQALLEECEASAARLFERAGISRQVSLTEPVHASH